RYKFDVEGFAGFRIHMSAYSSGVVNAALSASLFTDVVADEASTANVANISLSPVLKKSFGTPVASNDSAPESLILSAQDADGSTVTSFLNQPDIPRTIVSESTGFSFSGNVIYHGTDITNAVISETTSVGQETTRAFKTITSIDVPNSA